MSQYRKIKTELKVPDALEKALMDLWGHLVRTAKENSLPIAYSRKQARFVVPSRAIGTRYDDLAFVETQEGFEVQLADHSAVDTDIAQKALAQVKQRYTYHLAKAKAEEQGYQVYESLADDGSIVLELERAY